MSVKTKNDALPSLREGRNTASIRGSAQRKCRAAGPFQEVRRDLSKKRERLREQHGGDKITPEAEILIDNVIEGLGVQKLLGLYVRKYGVIDERTAKQGRRELSPILGRNWVGYANVVRQGILALKELEKGRQDAPHAKIEAILTSYSRQPEPSEERSTGKEETPTEAESGSGKDAGSNEA